MHKKDKNFDLLIVAIVALVGIFSILNNGNDEMQNFIGEAKSSIQGKPAKQCTDTDNGKDYFVKGSVITTHGPVRNDHCKDQIMLREFYCKDNNNFGFVNYNCSNGCLYGVCRNISIKELINQDYGITVMDNNGLDIAQLKVMQNILKSVPKQAYTLKYVTVKDFFPPDYAFPDEVSWQTSINIFGMDVGNLKEDGIPDSVDQYSDTFSIFFVHELNHRVSYLYSTNPNLAKFMKKEQLLIERAGTNRLNYVRSMFDDGFFQSYPQEFFASLSNAYFQDSILAIDLGIERFNQGYKEPINQILFIIDIYSLETLKAPLYRLNEKGEIFMSEATLKRDSNNNIIQIITPQKTYSFGVDGEGFVTNVI